MCIFTIRAAIQTSSDKLFLGQTYNKIGSVGRGGGGGRGN